MHKKFPFVFVAALLLLAMACKKDPPLPDPPNVSCDKRTNDVAISKQLIVGTWQWAYSKFRSRFLGTTIITNPQTDSIERSMTFNSDGRLMIYENGVLKQETTYKFRKMSEWSLFPGDSTRYIFSWKGSDVTWRICNDSLYLPYQSFTYDWLTDQVWKKN